MKQAQLKQNGNHNARLLRRPGNGKEGSKPRRNSTSAYYRRLDKLAEGLRGIQEEKKATAGNPRAAIK